MSSQCRQLFEPRTLGDWLPKMYLVFGVAMCRDQFIHIVRVKQVAHLRVGGQSVLQLQGQSIPQSDRSISCTSSSGQSTVLVRTPSDSFHSCFMSRELGDG